mgnify:CR=1 FL=1|tara:strand:- start:173 stop:412 length:240 start_codon:yes stop_codon:yes gene_type:complete
MALVTKNGQIHITPSKKGKQKGLVTKNGQISTLIPYLPADVVADESTDLGFSAVNGVAVGSIAAVSGVAKASISKVNGV